MMVGASRQVWEMTVGLCWTWCIYQTSVRDVFTTSSSLSAAEFNSSRIVAGEEERAMRVWMDSASQDASVERCPVRWSEVEENEAAMDASESRWTRDDSRVVAMMKVDGYPTMTVERSAPVRIKRDETSRMKL